MRSPGRIGAGAARIAWSTNCAAASKSARAGCFLGTRAGSLRVERGRVTGIEASNGGGSFALAADAVVIADGGFPGNAELFRRYIGPRPDRVLMRHAGTALGDGLNMAEATAPGR